MKEAMRKSIQKARKRLREAAGGADVEPLCAALELEALLKLAEELEAVSGDAEARAAAVGAARARLRPVGAR